MAFPGLDFDSGMASADQLGCAAAVLLVLQERVHGRLAMVGLGAMILIELLKGSALL